MHAVHGRRRVDLGRRQASELRHVVRDDGRDREDDELSAHRVGGRQRGGDVGDGIGSDHELHRRVGDRVEDGLALSRTCDAAQVRHVPR